jgi:hypothetical protein
MSDELLTDLVARADDFYDKLYRYMELNRNSGGVLACTLSCFGLPAWRVFGLMG